MFLKKNDVIKFNIERGKNKWNALWYLLLGSLKIVYKINVIFGIWAMVNANGCRQNEKNGLQRMRTYNDTAWKI